MSTRASTEMDSIYFDEDLQEYHKSFMLGPNNYVHFKRRYDRGFWSISLSRGGLPEYMQGGYSSLAKAKKAAEEYFRVPVRGKIREIGEEVHPTEAIIKTTSKEED